MKDRPFVTPNFSKFNINYLMEVFDPILERAVKYFYLRIIFLSQLYILLNIMENNNYVNVFFLSCIFP